MNNQRVVDLDIQYGHIANNVTAFRTFIVEKRLQG